MKNIIGRKVGMTSVFTDDGRSVPVTVIAAGPCTVVQRKTVERDGYDAVALSLGDAKKSRLTGALAGHYKKAGVSPGRDIREFRVGIDGIEVGQTLTVEGFAPGDRVDVCGVSKGHGFSGGIKRWTEWPLGEPDLVIKMPKAFKVPAEGRDIYRNFAIATGLTEDKWVKAIDFRPGAKSVVHHSLFFLDPSGTAAKNELASGVVGTSGGMSAIRAAGGKEKEKDKLGGILGRLGGAGGLGGSQASLSGAGGLGGWALGAQARALPDGLAYRLPKGADIILSTHFHPSGKAEEEASTIALYFADKAPSMRFTGLQVPLGFGVLAGINIAPGQKDFRIEDSFVLPTDVKAFAISAHAHYLAKEFDLTATPPDGGKAKTLLHISDWDFGWQENYQIQDYLTLPKGTKLNVKISYDNSPENPNNPTSPPRRVRWGKESTDEMGSVTLQVVAAKEEDFPRLQEGYRRFLTESALNAAKKQLRDKK